jgi:hypothetical protein
MGVEYFIAADAVCSESLAAYIFEQPSLDVGLDCIMYLDVMLLSELTDMIDRLVEQLHVIEIERCGNLLESIYYIDV